MDKVKRAVQRFFDSKFLDGEVVPHDWLAWALEIPQARTLEQAKDVQWIAFGLVEKFKETLLVEHCIYLSSVYGKGYLVVPPNEQAREAFKKAIKGIQAEVSNGLKAMKHTRLDALDTQERKRHVDAEIKLASIQNHMTSKRKDVFKLFDGRSR